VFAGRDPLVVTTLLGLTGGSTSRFASPTVEYKEDGTTASWKGIDGTLTVGGAADSIACNFIAPGLEFDNADTQASVGQIRFTCDGRRAFEVLYVGSMNLEIAVFKVASHGEPPVTAEKLHYAVDVKAEGDYLDAALRVGADAIDAKQFKGSDVHYD